mgnify:FL=1
MKVEGEFRVIIAGGRDFSDYELLKRKVLIYTNEVNKDNLIVVVSGKAKGADSFGEKLAKEIGWKVLEYPADWDSNGKSAGYIRNIEMAKNADALIAFWDKKSRGTKHMIDAAEKNNLLVRVVNY